MTKQKLELKYGIRIEDDSYYNPERGKYVKQYKIYTADGCPWDNGFRSLEAVEAECVIWAKQILGIKERVMGRR